MLFSWVIYIVIRLWRCLQYCYQILETKIQTLRGFDTVQILYKSPNFLVVNKSYDVLINSNDPKVKRSIQLQVRKLFPSLVNPSLHHDFHFVHRLDYVTSGILCIALNKSACSAGTLAFEERRAKKYYLAILRGHVAKESLNICEAIGEDISEQHGNHRMCISTNPNCKSPRFANTMLLVLQRGFFASYPATKVLLRPITGRRHQLRVHCTNIGHTIVGDYTYSNRKDTGPWRTFLHAFRLVLPNNVEPLHIQTLDPFPNENDPTKWMVVETWNELDEIAFKKLDTVIK